MNWNQKNAKRVKSAIEQEGIDYCFESYSDWSEIENNEFHALRENYLNARRRLLSFVDKGAGLAACEDENEPMPCQGLETVRVTKQDLDKKYLLAIQREALQRNDRRINFMTGKTNVGDHTDHNQKEERE